MGEGGCYLLYSDALSKREREREKPMHPLPAFSLGTAKHNSSHALCLSHYNATYSESCSSSSSRVCSPH